jgi:hypothetical protein
LVITGKGEELSVNNPNLTAIVALGAIFGVLFGAIGTVLGFESVTIGVAAGGITGVVVAMFVSNRRANSR